MRIGRSNKQGCQWYVTCIEDGGFLIHEKHLRWLLIIEPDEDLSPTALGITELASCINELPATVSREMIFLRRYKNKKKLKKEIRSARNMNLLIRKHEMEEEERYWNLLEAAEVAQDAAIRKSLEKQLVDKYAPVLERLSKE